MDEGTFDTPVDEGTFDTPVDGGIIDAAASVGLIIFLKKSEICSKYPVLFSNTFVCF